MPRLRLDKLLVGRGLAPTRERARALIEDGKVVVDGAIALKSGTQVDVNAPVYLREPDHPWVSRGGLKLVAALAHFGVDPTGRAAIDVGASTGGFTDVLLSHGARKVYAVDVGYGQLAWKLRQDRRVVVLERENIRHLDAAKIDEACDLAVIDASFISLKLVLPKVAELLQPGGEIIALIKPQFEVGKDEVGKGGVVRDLAARAAAVAEVRAWADQRGMSPSEAIESPIHGPAGNVEFLVLLRSPSR
jgi:23S rRNA (cytidine1920-2'-O)/16S rRNA (cytidine1409-2'-O)-methyltransferase